MATKKATTRKTTVKRKTTTKKTPATTRKKTVSAQKVRFFGVELSYFIIPAIMLSIWFFDKWFMIVGLDWVKALHIPEAGWFHYTLWYAAYLYTMIALVLLWNAHQRNQQFWNIIGALGINLFCFSIEHYVFFILHSIGGALLFFIGAALSLGYVIYFLWQKHRLIASLFLPYEIALLASIYVLHTAWMLN